MMLDAIGQIAHAVTENGRRCCYISQALRIGPAVYVRTQDGRCLDGAGGSLNAVLGNVPISRLAADQAGTLYVERGDGLLSVALARGVLVA